MTMTGFETLREDGLGLIQISNAAGLVIEALPNGALFAFSHRDARGVTMINQVLGAPTAPAIGRILLRIGGADPMVATIMGSGAAVSFGHDDTGFAFEGRSRTARHRATLTLDPQIAAWFWHIDIMNEGDAPLPFDILHVQDIGLGGRGFLMGSEAYASHYLDHHIERHPVFGPVIMSRQNLDQGGRHPWLAQGCLEGAASFASDAMQLFGPSYRRSGAITLPFGSALPGAVLQHEVACPTLQSCARTLAAGETARVTFFGTFLPDHPAASGRNDLQLLDGIAERAAHLGATRVTTAPVTRSLLETAPLAIAEPIGEDEIDRLYPNRAAEERLNDQLLSFFVAEGAQNRHVVTAAKEELVARRHGSILRSGDSLMPNDRTLSATCWMQGIFAAQLTIGNTSFHKLFSLSRDPYGLTRASGLRILAAMEDGWHLLGVPSLFEMGLSDCRWIYRLGARTLTVHAALAGDEAAMQWSVTVDGAPLSLLVIGHLVLGERDFEQTGSVAIDATAKRARFAPGSDWLWGRTYPAARLDLVTATPEAVEAIGDSALAFPDGVARPANIIVLRSVPTNRLVFAVTGSMTKMADAEAMADRYGEGRDNAGMLIPAQNFWNKATRALTLSGTHPDIRATNLLLPWLAHDAIVHLSVPHGLEQSTGAAWGTRDVCQGPVEFLLALRQDGAARDILCMLFAEQHHETADWPQWFMLPPYSEIRAGEAHGDVIVWPLKALCDYVEASGDVGILAESVGWRGSAERSTIAAHAAALIDEVERRFIPGTHLIRYGEGDWNDSLQPLDPHLKDWMVSSWTAGLLYQQLRRYAALLERTAPDTWPGAAEEARRLLTLADAIGEDFKRHLVSDGITAGYAIFDATGQCKELLLHPSDRRTGLSYSLIAITQSMLGGLVGEEEIARQLDAVAASLSFPDGMRLMDRPVTYAGGPETLFRRAESSAFFGREIGLMYVHAHLRQCEVLAKRGSAEALWSALALANPIRVTDILPSATLRQRNTYFSSSDAAFPDRYHAQRDWEALRGGRVNVDGGWRTYSSGPGIMTRLIMELALGLGRGPLSARVLPAAFGAVSVHWQPPGSDGDSAN